jgi:hypothetical protein
MLWDHAYGAELSIARQGMAGAVTSRAEAHALRLSMLYALLEGNREIDVRHVKAALALWRCCERSAREIWGDSLGWPTADKILAAARDRRRLTGTDIRDLFGRHPPADQELALSILVARGLLRIDKEKTAGAPRTVVLPCDISDIGDQRVPA